MELIISIVLCLLVLGYALYKKALTLSGIITSILVASITIYIASLKGLVLLLIVFILLTLADKISKKIRKKEDQITKKTGARDGYQVVANCGIACVMLIVYKITNLELYLIAYAVSLASALSDSFASDIGVLSKGKTFTALSLKDSDKGLSGNISILGLFASFVGAFIVGLSFSLLFKYNIYVTIFIAIMGFIGAYLDSILGETIQVKYKCKKCKIITEKTMHCDEKTSYYKGNKMIDNDVINFLSILIATLIALLIWK